MAWYFWRARVAYWFRHRSGMSFLEAWRYSRDMQEFFTDEYGPSCPRDAVDIEISYWEH